MNSNENWRSYGDSNSQNFLNYSYFPAGFLPITSSVFVWFCSNLKIRLFYYLHTSHKILVQIGDGRFSIIFSLCNKKISVKIWKFQIQLLLPRCTFGICIFFWYGQILNFLTNYLKIWPLQDFIFFLKNHLLGLTSHNICAVFLFLFPT